jgi:hypothetical protein
MPAVQPLPGEACGEPPAFQSPACDMLHYTDTKLGAGGNGLATAGDRPTSFYFSG